VTDFQGIWEGFTSIGGDPRIIAMWVIAGALLFVGIVQRKEPLLLIPIGTGILLANLPLGELTRDAATASNEGEAVGFIWVFQEYLLHTDILPLLIFLGLGALTDFEPMLSNPKTLLLGAGAQAGVFVALIGALLLGMTQVFDFGLLEASSIGIIGGADGPTTIYIGTRMYSVAVARDPGAVSIVGATAVAAYSYMALVPIIQPPVIKLLTTRRERRIRMPYAFKPVSRRTKILFPIVTTIAVGVLVPKASPLIGIMMFGNLLRESGVVPRLSSAAQNEMMNIVIILLGLAVGATMPGRVFLQWETIAIFLLGLVAFMSATAAGVLLGKVMNWLSGGRINPMIGAAGVSAVPMAARVVQQMAQEEDPENFLLMHAMGPNVAGVIGTAAAAGVLLAVVPRLVG